MNITRITALVRRHLLLTFRSADRLLNLIYWPLITLIVWGSSFLWIGNQENAPHLLATILTAIILWQVTYRISLEVANNLYEEILSRNIVNLFSTPLCFAEWIVAMIILSIFDTIAIGIISSCMLWMLFNINLFAFGLQTLLCFLVLFISGLSFGFIVSSMFIYWGSGMRDMMHAIVWLIGALSALYSPVAVLPLILQKIAWVLPTTYVFEAVRFFMSTGQFPYYEFMMSGILSIIYCIFGLILFKTAFEISRAKGFARLL